MGWVGVSGAGSGWVVLGVEVGMVECIGVEVDVVVMVVCGIGMDVGMGVGVGVPILSPTHRFIRHQ